MTPTLAEVLASAELPDSDTARLDAELLLCHAIGKPRTYLRTWPERRPDAEQLRRFEQLLSQRRSGVPIAYLLGEQGFWSLQLEVSNRTLIPRPDTERLVEVALELGPQGAAEVLDLGTGTGAIALALAAERPDWQLTGVDRVAEAVALARRNADAALPTVAELVPTRGATALVLGDHDPALLDLFEHWPAAATTEVARL